LFKVEISSGLHPLLCSAKLEYSVYTFTVTVYPIAKMCKLLSQKSPYFLAFQDHFWKKVFFCKMKAPQRVRKSYKKDDLKGNRGDFFV